MICRDQEKTQKTVARKKVMQTAPCFGMGLLFDFSGENATKVT